MADHPLKVLETLDPELLRLVQRSHDFAIDEGILPKKVKLLIALALDASKGATEGVTSLARAALAAGATRQEIAETLRVTHYICGAGSIYTAARGLKDTV
jgi:alkylhydroperoxidase/carboxymuconolactone decarboxylase family protein YurZ